VLTQDDLINLLKLLTRSTFQGIEEAEIGVALKAKLVEAIRQAQENKDINSGHDLSTSN
jgi:hypothetical protein